ncbi:MAG: tetratricopeptide repeat protein [Planctomycetota bacterium]|nr:MAG: tetratricopeptide repeat protein [Planctomycetota bacterium]
MNKLIFLVPIIVVLLCPVAAASESSDPSERFVQGARYMRTAEWASAEQAFLDVLDSWPGHPDVKALLGITRYHLGKYSASKSDLDYALKEGTKYESRVLYYLGMVCSKLGLREKSVDAFDRLLTEFPDSPEAEKIGVPDVLLEPEEPDDDKDKEPERFKFLFIQDISHDTNAPLAHTPEPDTAFFSYLSMKLGLHPAPFYLKTSGMSLVYLDMTNQNLMSAMGGVEGDFNLGESTKLIPGYSYHRLWLDNDKFQKKYRYELLWEQEWEKKHWFTDLRLRYEKKDFEELEKENLDGNHSSAQARLWWKGKSLGPFTRVRIGAYAGRDTAELDYLEYDSVEGSLEIELTFPADITLDLGASFGQRDYSERHPDFGINREDDRFRADALLLIPFSDNFFLRLKGSYISNDSNIRDYTYYQTVYGAGFMLTF